MGEDYFWSGLLLEGIITHARQRHELRFWLHFSFFFFFLLFYFGVTFVHANLCMHILASIFQGGGNPCPVTRLLVLSSVTD